MQIATLKEKIGIKSKEKELLEEINNLKTYFPQYWYAVYLYAKAVACEIVLAKVDDPQDLFKRKENVLFQIENYSKVLEDSKKHFGSLIKKSKVYNKRKLPTRILRLYGHHSNSLLIYDLVAGVSEMYSDYRSHKGKETLQEFQQSMRECGDIKVLNEQVIRIEEHSNRLCNPVDIIQIDGETYIRYRKNSISDEEKLDK